jgi:hypothetical protein
MVLSETGSDFTELAVIEQLPPPALTVTLKVGVKITLVPQVTLNCVATDNGAYPEAVNFT